VWRRIDLMGQAALGAESVRLRSLKKRRTTQSSPHPTTTSSTTVLTESEQQWVDELSADAGVTFPLASADMGDCLRVMRAILVYFLQRHARPASEVRPSHLYCFLHSYSILHSIRHRAHVPTVSPTSMLEQHLAIQRISGIQIDS
jgi:hypothetical protein